MRRSFAVAVLGAALLAGGAFLTPMPALAAERPPICPDDPDPDGPFEQDVADHCVCSTEHITDKGSVKFNKAKPFDGGFVTVLTGSITDSDGDIDDVFEFVCFAKRPKFIV